MATLPRVERPHLKIRQPTIRLSALTPHYWLADNPVATHFMNALSCLLPPSESFFVRSMLVYRSSIRDRELKVELRNFAGQESMHNHEYRKVTQWLDDYGLPATGIMCGFDRYLRRLSQIAPAKLCIAYTAAVEHLIAAVSHGILSDRALIQSIHPDVRSLWLWHAMEEIEHKSVAFDMARVAGVGYLLRCLTLITSLIGLVFTALFVQMIFLIRDTQYLNIQGYLKFFRMLFETGLVRRVFSYIFAYFRSDFHPWQLDERPLLRAGRRMLKESLTIQKEVLIPSVQSPILSKQARRGQIRSLVPKNPPFRCLFSNEIGFDHAHHEESPSTVGEAMFEAK